MNLSLSVDTRTNLILGTTKADHCVKSVCVRSWCELFPAFGLNMDTYRVSLRIHSECGEIRVRSTPNTITFHAVDVSTSLRYFDIIIL